MATRRFPLLAKALALASVFIALTIALHSVSGVVAEREGRLREAERSVAASLAAAQTVVGPVIERDCSESWETIQGEGKDRKTVTERRDFKLSATPADARRQGRRRDRAAPPWHLQGQRLRAEGAPGRRLERRCGAGSRGAPCRLASALRRAGAVRRPGRRARRAQRRDADRRRRRAGARRHPARRPPARLSHRRRRVVRRRAPGAARRSRDRARRHRRARVRAGRRQHPGDAVVGLAAPVVRRPLPADRSPGRRRRLQRPLAAQCPGDDGAAGGRRRRARVPARRQQRRRRERRRRSARRLHRDLRRRLHRPGEPVRR